jgi:hypothetical protein
MLYYNTDPQRQLMRERAEHLSHEMRRVRPTSEEDGHLIVEKMTVGLFAHAVRLRRRGSWRSARRPEATL